MSYKDRSKQREYQRNWWIKRRQQWIQENGPCGNCGSWDDLQVDHIDPNTKISHSIWSWSKERREEELKKCQVLCTDCHKAKTAKYLKNFRGWNHPRSKLTEEDVNFIRENYSPYDAAFGAKSLAEKFGVADSTIVRIAYRQVYDL